MDYVNLGENHLVSDNSCNIVNLECPKKFYKEKDE